MSGCDSRLGRRARISWAILIAVAMAACDNPQPPMACGPLPQVTVNVGESTTVAACFNDPNGDVLTYTATSSSPTVATASISGSNLTVAARAPGNASVTITASDPEGLQGQQSFHVMVPNRPPQPRGTIPPLSVSIGETGTIDASQYFTEPDGEALTYSAISSNPVVATVSAGGSTVTVTADAKGTSNVTITATDPGGLAATQTFQTTVPNRGPVSVGTIRDRIVEVGESLTLDVAQHFEDPDGDPLTYSATSSNSSVARATVSGSILTITASAPGTVTITVTAWDTDRATVNQTFRATVPQPNRAPRRVGSIPAQTLAPGSTATLDGFRYFSDPDGDSLTYTATSSSSSVARVSVSRSTVTITAVATGSATITVTAHDPDGLTATQPVRVTVGTAGAPDLEVTTVTPMSVTGSPGDTVWATFTIRNSGTAASAATTVRILISSDTNISTSDREIGDFRLRALTPGETLTSRRGLIMGNTEGTRYWGLCIESVAGESDTQNNCSRSVRVTVGTSSACTNDLGTIPDGRTVKRTGSWDGGCRSVHYPNGEFARYYSFTLSERLSTTIDLTSPSVDTWLALRRGGGTGIDLVESDDDGGTGTNSRIVRTLAAGRYTIEATTAFGGRTGPFTLTLAVGGGSSGPDLEFTEVSPRTLEVRSDRNFQITATLLNSGDEASSPTKLRAYLSNDPTITERDPAWPTSYDVAALSPSETRSIRFTGSITFTGTGTRYFGFCVEAVSGESDTTNNCSESVRLSLVSSSSQTLSTVGLSVAGEGATVRIERARTRATIELPRAVPRIKPGHVSKGTRPRSDANLVIVATMQSSDTSGGRDTPSMSPKQGIFPRSTGSSPSWESRQFLSRENRHVQACRSQLDRSSDRVPALRLFRTGRARPTASEPGCGGPAGHDVYHEQVGTAS
ncbi:MAG: hypothetical protein F4205_04665 [Gemmatimonadetes bacterium]|nr:hypothetical protein [Gemmatimonadota bacterium]MYC90175.1 hypothetical protein [Gemmatimonadota bacterium]MYG34764.1 hypothetical protein [Gemmatimonadota bacterium]